MSATTTQDPSESMQMSMVRVDPGGSSDSDLEADSMLMAPLSMWGLDTQRVPMDTHYQSEFG